MVYDDLILGSGLTALSVAYGLDSGRKVCVLADSRYSELHLYDSSSNTPCANNGFGGLGSYWHGVIPTGQPCFFFDADRHLFEELFNHFYPDSVGERYGQPWLFVPYRPIRPAMHWKKLCIERGNLKIAHVKAELIEYKKGVWTAIAGGVRYSAKRIWLAAGALGTPAILENSPEFQKMSRSYVSDHVILYLGQIDRRRHPHILAPKVDRKASGVWMQGSYDSSNLGLITTKPARFSYAILDHGIEQRSAFGLPTAGVMAKIWKAGSLGLISEAMFNKLGLFPDSNRLSVYAQIRIEDAYRLNPGHLTLDANITAIQSGIGNFRHNLEMPELELSKQPELYIRGIHLHNSLNMDLLANCIAYKDKNITIVDSSCITDIGPEHHSFKMMVKAFSLAKFNQT